MGIESPLHLLFIAVVALLVLGPKRLPKLARALGQGMREFREAVNEGSSPAEPARSGRPMGPGEPAAPGEAEAPEQVDPAEPVRSGDAPDRRAL
jgi:TatA/E family protein of Tat protein translocase